MAPGRIDADDASANVGDAALATADALIVAHTAAATAAST
jgi:hypothetical protein